jgi:hypothetical protein
MIAINDNGGFYPAYGICLGFENMAIWASDAGADVLTNLEAHGISLKLDFDMIYPAETKMFGGLGEKA